MIPEWLFQLAGMGFTGAAVYAGIKADLATLHNKVENAALQASKAHDRIDRLFEH